MARGVNLKRSYHGLTVFFFLLLGFQVQGFPIETWGAHFVETSAPEWVAVGHPDRDSRMKEYHNKTFEIQEYVIKIKLPVEHFNPKKPETFVTRVTIQNKSGSVMHFKFKKWTLTSGMGKTLDGLVRHVGDAQQSNAVEINTIIGKEFHPRFVMPHDFEFYYDIPERSKKMDLSFSLECYDEAGNPDVLSGDLPLKRLTYKRQN